VLQLTSELKVDEYPWIDEKSHGSTLYVFKNGFPKSKDKKIKRI